MSVSITLDKTRYETAPGDTFTIAVTVTNNGAKVQQFHLTLRGVPGAKVNVDPPVLNLEGGRHEKALVRVSVPVDAPIKAGRHVAGIHVWAKSDPALQMLREFELSVSPHPSFTLSAAKKGRRKGRYQHAAVTLANTGNVPLRMRVTGTDPANLVNVELPEGTSDVPPFDRAEFDAFLRGPFRAVGTPVTHVVRFRAEGMQLEQSTDYTMEQRAWLGKSFKPYLAIALVAIALVVLWPRYAVLADYVGQPIEEVEESLQAAGISHEVEREDGTMPAGTVMETQPAAGEQVRLGGILGLFAEPVLVVASNGPPTMQVPAGLVNQLKAVAEDQLGELRSFGVLIEFQKAPSDEVAEQRVVATRPPSGEPLQVGDTLTVIVSSGPTPFDTPSFMGMDLGELNVARDQLGLEVERIDREVDDPELDGKVVAQNPLPGEEITRGSTVTVWIGVFEEPEPGPLPDPPPLGSFPSETSDFASG